MSEIEDEAQRVKNLLNRKLEKFEIASRTGPGNQKLSYLEGHKAIELANEIFAYNGWSCNIENITQDFCEKEGAHFKVGISCIVRVTLKDGSFHEDLGYGEAKMPQRGAAMEKAKKSAVTDARKRALRLFGSALGNCLSDKDYIKDMKSTKAGSHDSLPSPMAVPATIPTQSRPTTTPPPLSTTLIPVNNNGSHNSSSSHPGPAHNSNTQSKNNNSHVGNSGILPPSSSSSADALRPPSNSNSNNNSNSNSDCTPHQQQQQRIHHQSHSQGQLQVSATQHRPSTNTHANTQMAPPNAVTIASSNYQHHRHSHQHPPPSYHPAHQPTPQQQQQQLQYHQSVQQQLQQPPFSDVTALHSSTSNNANANSVTHNKGNVSAQRLQDVLRNISPASTPRQQQQQQQPKQQGSTNKSPDINGSGTPPLPWNAPWSVHPPASMPSTSSRAAVGGVPVYSAGMDAHGTGNGHGQKRKELAE